MAKTSTRRGRQTVPPEARKNPLGKAGEVPDKRTTRHLDASIPYAPEQPTSRYAEVFARLLHIGCPADHAVYLMFPRTDKDAVKGIARMWLASKEVLDAVETLNGGNYIELPPDRRYQLAFEKHLSEIAFYLHNTNFVTVESREGLEKMKQAREVLRAELKPGSEDDPMVAFARFALEVVKTQSETQAQRRTKPPELWPPNQMPVTITPTVKES